MLHTKSKRINWVDQLKGFSIILVVYGHNLPFIDIYIESFRIPLFFFIAGFFHPKSTTFSKIKKLLYTEPKVLHFLLNYLSH